MVAFDNWLGVSKILLMIEMVIEMVIKIMTDDADA